MKRIKARWRQLRRATGGKRRRSDGKATRSAETEVEVELAKGVRSKWEVDAKQVIVLRSQEGND